MTLLPAEPPGGKAAPSFEEKKKMSTNAKADFGVIGLAVMAATWRLTSTDHGFSIAVWNLEQPRPTSSSPTTPAPLVGTKSLAEFVGALEEAAPNLDDDKAGKRSTKCSASFDPCSKRATSSSTEGTPSSGDATPRRGSQEGRDQLRGDGRFGEKKGRGSARL